MNNSIALGTVFFLFLLSANLYSQTPKTALDRYLDESKTLLIAKCTHVGNLKANLVGEISIQILYVVKGKEKIREVSFDSYFKLDVGQRYLIRSIYEPTPSGRYLDVKDFTSAVQIPEYGDIEELKTFPPRIVVLRIMNLRADTLESEIRRRQYELDALNEIIKVP